VPYELRIQDPSSALTRYLDEEVIALLRDDDVTVIEGIFAFATVRGAAAIVGDPAFQEYTDRRGILRLILGLDAITDRVALEFMVEAQRRHPGRLEVKVYKNPRAGLFHPKLLRANRNDDSGLLIVGSGNLTPGGLRSNLEAYSVYRFDANDPPDQSEWDRFLAEHAADITDIDDDALERGQRNGERVAASRGAARAGRARPRGRVRAEEAEEAVAAATEESALPEEVAPEATGDDRMLVAEVPKAGGRWQQVHFNEDVTRLYFRASPHSSDRVVLYRLEPGGGLVREAARPVILSGTNLNHRIEFGSHRGVAYPDSGRPLLVLREIGLRTHTYAMLMPGEPGHAEMERFLSSHPSVGRGMRRVISNRSEVSRFWPGLPL
jgi:hypothetical protein